MSQNEHGQEGERQLPGMCNWSLNTHGVHGEIPYLLLATGDGELHGIETKNERRGDGQRI